MVDLNGTLLMQIVNFIILCAILGHFCYKPVLKVLDDRKARIKNDLDSAAQSKAAAEELKVSYEAQLKDAQAKAQEIVDKAVKEAKVQAQAQIDEAHASNRQSKGTGQPADRKRTQGCSGRSEGSGGSPFLRYCSKDHQQEHDAGRQRPAHRRKHRKAGC